MTRPTSLLSSMIEAAHAAGDGLTRDFAALSSLTIEHKAGLDDPVSAADLRAEAKLRERLAAIDPSFGFLGEEGGLVEGVDKSNVWVVDPLDGTSNFLRGLPLFAVNVALVREGVPIAGVTHIPMLKETFWAETGSGAFLNGKPIQVSNCAEMISAILAVGIPFASKPHHERFHREMEYLTSRVSGIRRLGAAAVDMAYVACGHFDAYWEQSVSAWDIAAGVVIVREAGGLVTDTSGRPLVLDEGTVFASSPQIHAELLEVIRPDAASAT